MNHVLQGNKALLSILGKGGHTVVKDLLHTLDTMCSNLHRQGIGAIKNSAKVIELDHEDI